MPDPDLPYLRHRAEMIYHAEAPQNTYEDIALGQLAATIYLGDQLARIAEALERRDA